jgi:RNA polymerase-binding transcription factor DksA
MLTRRERGCWPNVPRWPTCSPTPSRRHSRTEDEEATVYVSDAAQPLTEEGIDDAVADSMRERLATIDRALRRLDDGTYGRSVRSGLPIPDDRLEADPAAELTIEEARAQ